MSRPLSFRRASRGRIAATAFAVPCLLLAACAGGAQPTAQANSTAVPLPGGADDTLVVGYTLVEGGAVATATDGQRADDSDPLVQARVVQAYVDFVNSTGGAGGHKLRAEVVNYPAVTGSRDQASSLCDTFTVEKKVFAAVLDGQYDDEVLECYQRANTLVLDESLVGHDTTQFDEYAPYLWSPTHPEYSALLRTQLAAMRDERWFENVVGVQILQADTDVARRATADIVEPFLASVGVRNTQVSVVDISSSTALATSVSTALAEGVAGDFERVLTIGGGPIVSTALVDEGADYYASTWGVSTFDTPGLLTSNPARIVTGRLVGTSGFGYAPAYDVDAERGGPFPDPARPAEAVCKGVLDAAGITLGEGQRPDYRSAFQFCDATLFLKAALDRVPPNTVLTAEAFASAVGRIGSRYASSLTFGSGLTQGQYAATNAGRVLTIDASCACFTYKGENVRITAN